MTAFTTGQFRHLVRASALYDLLLTAGFATPWTLAPLLRELSALNLALGGQALPAFTAFHSLIAHLLGSIVIVWSLLRLRSPEPRFGRYDAAARALFTLWMVHALLLTGAPLLWLFIVPEALWALLQAAPVKAKPQPGRDAA